MRISNKGKHCRVGMSFDLRLESTHQVSNRIEITSLINLYLDRTFGWKAGSGLRLQCSHLRSHYQVEEPIPLSETLVPIVLLKTMEMEYLGHPYTRCINGNGSTLIFCSHQIYQKSWTGLLGLSTKINNDKVYFRDPKYHFHLLTYITCELTLTSINGDAHSTPLMEHTNTTVKTSYDISICKMLRNVLAIIKMWCFHQLVSQNFVLIMN